MGARSRASRSAPRDPACEKVFEREVWTESESIKKNSRYPSIKKDADGNMLYRGCGKPVPKWRQTWCSNHCFDSLYPSKVRRQVWNRDKGQCALCSFKAEKFHSSPHEWEADHVIPFSSGGPSTADNLRTLCIPCHKRETSKLASNRAKARSPQLQLL